MLILQNRKYMTETKKSVTLFSKELSLFVDLGDNFIYEDNYFVMLPGEKRKVKYRRYELE